MAGELERDYECERCGMRAIVVVEAVPDRTPFDKRADRVAPTAEDGLRAEDDASTSLLLVACPACGRRPLGAGIGSLLRVLGCGIGAVVGASLTLGFYWLITVPSGFVIGGLVGAAVEVRRWRAAARVRVIRELRPPQRLPLPAALAMRVPRRSLPAPASAPVPLPPPPPPDPSGGPRVLT